MLSILLLKNSLVQLSICQKEENVGYSKFILFSAEKFLHVVPDLLLYLSLKDVLKEFMLSSLSTLLFICQSVALFHA